MQQPAQTTEKGLSASALKTIAIVAMVIDHIAWLFVPTYSALGIAMHAVGRITGPTMFYLIAEGYHHTRDANRYTLRLAVFALISYLPFIYYEYGTLPGPGRFTPVGVIYTLLLGLLALRAIHEVRNPVLAAVLVFAAFVASAIGDWSLYGVAYIVAFDYFRGNRKHQFLAGSALVLLSMVPGVFTNPGFGLLQAGQFLPLILMLFYNGSRGKSGQVGKWFFYVFYPAHLVALRLLFDWMPRLQ